jgi:glyoxylase-like metal-dependent hydrolase (beta-lactamase superfamily II)
MLKKADGIVSAAYVNSGLLKAKPGDLNTDLLTIDLCVGEGDSLQLSDDLKINIIETPGHSPCSISAYFEKDQAMFVSDAAGYRSESGVMSPVFFQDYELYLNSIKKIMGFPTKILGAGHGETCTGTEVQNYYQDSLMAAEQSFADIKDRLANGISEDALAQILYSQYIKGALAYYPEDMMLGSMYQLIKSVKNCL